MTHPEQPFKVAIPDADIDLLRKKLELTRWPDELEGAGWAYGAPAADVRRLAARWKDGFDWRAAEKKINELPQFTRDIDVDGYGTINIHYVHKKSEAKDAIPLLFVHGCMSPFSPHCESSDQYYRAWPFPGGLEDSPAAYCRG